VIGCECKRVARTHTHRTILFKDAVGFYGCVSSVGEVWHMIWSTGGVTLTTESRGARRDSYPNATSCTSHTWPGLRSKPVLHSDSDTERAWWHI